MTTVYGSWVPNSTSNQRMRLRLEYTVPSVSAGQTSVTVTGSVYVEARYSFNDSNNTFSWSGSLLGSGSSAKSINVATNGSQQIHTFSKSVTLTNSTQGLSVAFSLTGIDYVGSSLVASVSATVTIPARAITTPNAPTGVGVTRVSDSRHDLTWTATATTDKPIASFEIQRYRLSNDTAGYFPVATIADPARAWVDYTNMANDLIDWRIRAVNAAGGSAWVYTDGVYTTPAAPTGVTVQRTGADASVTWTINARAAQTQTLQGQESSDGGATWSAWANLAGHVGFSAWATSRLVTGLDSTKQHRLRVVSTVTTPTTLNAYSAASNTLVLLTAPQAPTLLAPTGTVNRALSQTLKWKHNPVDTTPQTAAEVRHRPAGGSWTTVSVTTAQQLTVAGNTWPSGNVEWQVRTKGQHADFGAWSSTGVFTAAAAPAVAITSPPASAVIDTNKLEITIAYNDPQGAAMTSWLAELLSGGQVIETRTGNGATTSVTFATTLEDLTAYSATFRATAGTGLTSSTVTWSGSTDFIEPAPALLTATWDEPNGTVQLAIENTTVGGTAATVSNRIERSDDDGLTWQLVEDELPVNAGVGDLKAPLNTYVWYRAIAVSALGTEAVSQVVEVLTATSKVIWLSTFDGQLSLRLYYNLQVSWKEPNDVVFEEYYGDVFPTEHFGSLESWYISVSAVLTTQAEVETLRLMNRKRLFYRDFDGQVGVVVISANGISRDRGIKVLRPISLELTRVTDY